MDVIHTCGHDLGFFHTLGHADFYPNGGIPIQPGCGFDITGKYRLFSFFLYRYKEKYIFHID